MKKYGTEICQQFHLNEVFPSAVSFLFISQLSYQDFLASGEQLIKHL